MPKIVDHEAQRRLIAEAAVEWIAKHGLDTLSQRNVAAVSGRSKGNVQHYFPDKKSLMFGALRIISEHRAQRALPGPHDPDPHNPFSVLQRSLVAALPLDRDRADEWRVRLSLYVYADRDPEMQAYLADHAERILADGTGLVIAAQEQGRIRPGLDPRLTYRRLSAAISGIAVAALADGGALSAEEQTAMFAEVINSISVNADMN